MSSGYLTSVARFLPVAAIAMFVAACGGEAPEEGPGEPRPAKLLRIEQASSERTNSLPAVIRSVRSTDLAFQVGGQIIEWNAIDGAQFNRGDVIARLDDRTFKAAVEQAEAQYKNAKSEFDRAKRLIDEDAISVSVLESREAQVLVAEASLDTAKKNLSDTVLRAPFSGFVGRTNVEQFQNVGPQQSILLLQSSAVEAIVNVPGSFVLNSNQIRYFEEQVELDAAPGRRFKATFREATGVADASTQTFEGRFTFTPPPDLTVLTGMTATLFFTTTNNLLAGGIDGVSVPLAAILSEGDKRYVWVVKGENGEIERRDVTVANGVGEELIVTSGLEIGETVVAAGGAYLQAGERVRPWTD